MLGPDRRRTVGGGGSASPGKTGDVDTGLFGRQAPFGGRPLRDVTSGRDIAFQALRTFYRTRERPERILTNLPLKQLSTRDAGRVRVLVQECIRWQRLFDEYLNRFTGKRRTRISPGLKALTHILFYELLQDSTVPAYAAVHSAVELAKRKISRKAGAFVNALGQSLSGSRLDVSPPRELARRESFPDWMVRRWETRWGRERTTRICHNLNRGTGTVLRRNATLISENELLNALPDTLSLTPLPDSDCFYTSEESPGLWMQTELFRQGALSFQGRGAGAIVEWLDPRPGEIVLDVCAAPGTKSRYMAEKMRNQGIIYASDSSAERLAVARQDETRHPATLIQWAVKDATRDEFPLADAVLIDAPCSGTGIIGRRPDIKWRRSPRELPVFAALQTQMVTHMWSFVKPGGRLLYATCSLEQEENWDVLEASRKLLEHFEIVSPPETFPDSWRREGLALEILPDREPIDGMFGFLLKKVA
ncbi:MAG: hypothetical protein D6762_06610 [Candidatus Neomarinimicrobiota bacterium]|nr:MAG: hypothetical protein D6762_06610 [Candidatus Neomarinimicrobiota bacterium]